jgi:hypothetical protein
MREQTRLLREIGQLPRQVIGGNAKPVFIEGERDGREQNGDEDEEQPGGCRRDERAFS